MRINGNFEVPRKELDAFCRKWRITELALFGSVLREDFRTDSDIDVLVTFREDAPWSLWDIVHMGDELEQILGRPVDIAGRSAVETRELHSPQADTGVGPDRLCGVTTRYCWTLIAARKVARYTEDVTEEAFARHEILQDAVVRQVQIVGEAASRISAETRAQNPQVPWREMIGMRHRLVHDYSEIDIRRVWDAARRSVPELVSLLEPLVPPMQA